MGMQQQAQQPQRPLQGMGQQGPAYDAQAARLTEQRRRGSRGSPTSDGKMMNLMGRIVNECVCVWGRKTGSDEQQPP